METPYEMNEDMYSFKTQNSITSLVDDDSINEDSGGFECNICLDTVQDPVITLCGHLYCWPCIYTWIKRSSASPESTGSQEPRCPVCKVELSEENLIPIYGRDQLTNSSSSKASNLGLVVPQRPKTPQFARSIPPTCDVTTFSPMLGHRQSHMRSGSLAPHLDYQQPQYNFRPNATQFANVNHPGFGIFGARVYSLMFGDSSNYNTDGTNSRSQRHMKEVDISLSRLCFFMFCCMVLCLLSF